ncbi:ATP synthase F1 subunit delta [Flavobacterium sp. MK4S-17]|uniref:ATP synthase F1 subunit delta n=1 Tax=Flavobacterium sp. MK4S-17 TaxID=2543737 RepID=UPI00135B79C7|nr:ATP synthase F1 subunit delta [Flavobacterium sp. MK4S-17]
MTGSRAAIRYARAILDMAQTSGAAQQVSEDMALIAKTVEENKEFANFITSPIVKAEIKESALNEIFAGTHAVTQGLFRLLLENKRFEMLGNIAAQYKAQFDEMNGIGTATVTTAFPITPELETKVLAKIKEFSDKKITLKNIVDPAIIGGFILRVGDRQFNASVAHSLLTLKRELSN